MGVMLNYRYYTTKLSINYFSFKIMCSTCILLFSGSALPAVASQFECREPLSNSRIYNVAGALPADPEGWPFIVRLIHYRMPSFSFCGGSLVSQQWVLTAAHCLFEKSHTQRNSNTIRINSASIKTIPSDTSRKVVKSIVHPDYRCKSSPGYTETTCENDIALLKLDEPFAIEDSKLAYLPTIETERSWGASQTCASVAGWGITERKKVSDILLNVNVPILSTNDCAKKYSSQFDIRMKFHLCAGYESGVKDSCKGDSGGPLITRAGPTGYLLVGIVSFGDGCGKRGKPGVYTRVSTYRDWIFSTIASH